MSRVNLHDRIDELLGLLSINNNRLSLHGERLSQLDIDVLRKQCIELYEQINTLAFVGRRTKNVETAPVIPPVKPIPKPIVKPKPKVVVEQKPEPKPIIETPKVEPIVEVVKETPKPKKAPPKVKKVVEAEIQSLFEKFNSKPIASIPKAISVVKRFEFQSNFFDGDFKAYNEFMGKLDNAENREAAFEVYTDYKTRLEWDNEELKDELKALMYRKHGLA